MKYFFDTEFIENGKTIDLISIGIVTASGETFYRQNRECNFKNASDWVWRNVFPNLEHFDMRGDASCQGMPRPNELSNAKLAQCSPICPWRTRSEIRDDVRKFIERTGNSEKAQFWGYYSDYDWVAFCQLFGSMVDLPKGYPMFCMDLKQLCVSLGNPQLLDVEGGELHNALKDAEGIKTRYEWLMEQPPK